MKHRPLRESDIEKYLVKRAKELGGEVRKVQWIGRRGAPDRIVMLPWRCPRLLGGKVADGRNTIWIELKAPGVAPEPHQLREHKRMRDMGQRVEVVDSYERVDAVLA
jgi:hypothetical protein